MVNTNRSESATFLWFSEVPHTKKEKQKGSSKRRLPHRLGQWEEGEEQVDRRLLAVEEELQLPEAIAGGTGVFRYQPWVNQSWAQCGGTLGKDEKKMPRVKYNRYLQPLNSICKFQIMRAIIKNPKSKIQKIKQWVFFLLFFYINVN